MVNSSQVPGDGAAWSVVMSKKDIISPCTDICKYEEIDGEPRCISCFRTYEDLNNWFYMTNESRRERIKQIKKDRKNYERKQANNKDMGKES